MPWRAAALPECGHADAGPVLMRVWRRCGRELGEARWGRGHFEEAISLFHRFSTSTELADFLTIAAYDAVYAREATPPSKL